ncbi:PH domain-containing protein [Streptomyces sp. NPDC057428]|uniref:PH domain-containing protein n=1 Tax=Streptomyces sp. NPDC057428 TaxID=3346129 RepID=UPI0036B2CF57
MPVTLRRKWSAAAGMVAATAVVAFGAYHSAFPESQERWGGVRLGIGAGIVSLLFWVFVMRSRVVLTARGVEIVNPLVREWLPWGSVRDVELPREGGLVIKTAAGRDVHVWAFNGSLLDRGRTVRAAGVIERARPAVGDGTASLEEATRRWALPWRAALLCIGASVAVCQGAQWLGGG